MKYKVIVNDQEFAIEVDCDDEVLVDGQPVPVDFRRLAGSAAFSLLIGPDSYEALVEEGDDEYHVVLRGRMFNVQVEDERAQRLRHARGKRAAPSGEVVLKSPMPGLVVTVPVDAGQTVQEGDVLIVLESMKMENELKAPRDGTVTTVHVEPRQSVMQNEALLVLS